MESAKVLDLISKFIRVAGYKAVCKTQNDSNEQLEGEIKSQYL